MMSQIVAERAFGFKDEHNAISKKVAETYLDPKIPIDIVRNIGKQN